MSEQTLRVLPNPYSFVDQDGEPQGVCSADPTHAGGARMWIGAQYDMKRTKVHNRDDKGRKIKRAEGDNRPFTQTTKYVFVAEPVEIPQTAKYLNDIQCGDLIAADAATFAKAFGARKAFIPPDQQLAEARRRAFDEYKAATSKAPAFEREEIALEAPAAPSAEAPADGAAPALSASAEAPANETATGEAQPAADAPAEAPTGGTK